jgi:hypothetical protein
MLSNERFSCTTNTTCSIFAGPTPTPTPPWPDPGVGVAVGSGLGVGEGDGDGLGDGVTPGCGEAVGRALASGAGDSAFPPHDTSASALRIMAKRSQGFGHTFTTILHGH